MDLDWRKGEFLDDVGVGDGEGLVDGLALDPLGGEGAGGDGRAAAEGLEFGVLDDLGLGVDLIWRRMTSPHSGAPTRPVPTSDELLSRVPTLRGCS